MAPKSGDVLNVNQQEDLRKIRDEVVAITWRLSQLERDLYHKIPNGRWKRIASTYASAARLVTESHGINLTESLRLHKAQFGMPASLGKGEDGKWVIPIALIVTRR